MTGDVVGHRGHLGVYFRGSKGHVRAHKVVVQSQTSPNPPSATSQIARDTDQAMPIMLPKGSPHMVSVVPKHVVASVVPPPIRLLQLPGPSPSSLSSPLTSIRTSRSVSHFLSFDVGRKRLIQSVDNLFGLGVVSGSVLELPTRDGVRVGRVEHGREWGARLGRRTHSKKLIWQTHSFSKPRP